MGIPGYRLATKRNRLQQEDAGRVALFVDGDKQLQIYFDPEKTPGS